MSDRDVAGRDPQVHDPLHNPPSELAATQRAGRVIREVRWGVLLGGFVASYVVGLILAFLVIQAGWWEGYGTWEQRTLELVHLTVSPTLDLIFLWLPLMGTNYTLAPIVSVAAIILWRRGWPAMALHMVTAQLGSWFLNPALKLTLGRERPEIFEQRGQHDFPAFPSGHSIAVMGVMLTAAYLIHKTGRGTWAYWVVGVFFLLNSYSRVYLAVHWPTDVLAGTIIGGLWMLTVAYAFDGLHETRPTR